jgi:hypothetical protein
MSFPPKYREVVREGSGSETPMLNGTEYLERVFASGVRKHDLPVIPPLLQHRIWGRMAPGDGPGRRAGVIEELSREDDRFHIEGSSWTNDVSWLRGYDGTCSLSKITYWPQRRSVAVQKQGNCARPTGAAPGPASGRRALAGRARGSAAARGWW